MKDLIKIENGVTLIDPKISSKIAEFEKQIKAIEEKEKAIKEAIKAEMEAKGIIKVEDEINGMSISYIAPTYRETFATKRFKADKPDLYDEYITMTPVKASIRITLK